MRLCLTRIQTRGGYHSPGVSIEPGGGEHQVSGGVSLAQPGHEQPQQPPAHPGAPGHVLTYLKYYYGHKVRKVYDSSIFPFPGDQF